MLKATLFQLLRASPAVALGLITPAVCLHAQDSTFFHFEPKPGGYGVGSKVIEQYDHSPIYCGTTDELGKS